MPGITKSERATGGCQCGAIRYAIEGPFNNPHICHCRMCQKAFGNYFAALVGSLRKNFKWTKGDPGVFRSSPIVERRFCRDCGTPLSISDDDSKYIAVSIGSLDDPSAVRPENQYGIESRLPAFERLHALPGTRTEDDVPPERLAKFTSLQHPDSD